ncbi:MAG: hypothetical protein HY906_05865, partial [Deltaproteobacteria bacterium]|nr:hypothetical protein [Deltaproteobacteria bacterium]
MSTKKTVALTATVVVLLATAAVRGQSIPPVMTAKSLPPATVALIDPESGTSSGGGSSDIRIAVGDVVLFRFKYFTSPNNALRGIAGYLTEYVPPNTQVVGVRITDANGVTIPANYPGLTYNGTGGGKASFTVDCGAGNCSRNGGSLAQLYGDTGIFWTADASLAKAPANAFITLTNGLWINPEAEDANDVLDLLDVPNPQNANSYAHNAWDALQVQAFGTKNADGNGGNTPQWYGSPVAGNGAWYTYDATLNGAQIEFTNHVGPWLRVIYPSSTIGSGGYIGVTGELDRALRAIDFAEMPENPPWDYVTPAFPRTAKAVRFAVGELRAGEPGYVEVALKVTALPLDPGFDATYGNIDCGEIFGGNVAKTMGGSGSRGTKNAWPSFVPSPACVYLNLLFDIDVNKYRIGTGEYVTYSLKAKNLSLNPETNVCIRFRWATGSMVTLPPGGSTTPPAGCPACPGGTSCVYWKPGTMAPSQEWPSTGNVMNMLFDPSGGGHMATVMYADYFSTRVPGGFMTQAVTIISPIAYIKASLASTGQVNPGQNATLTGTIRNDGAGTGAFKQLSLWFPEANWEIVTGGSTLTNCHKITPPSGYTWNRWICDFVDTSFAPGEQQALNLTIKVPAGAQSPKLHPIDLQIWAFDNGNGGDYDTLFHEAVIQAVGRPRTDPPVVGVPSDPPVVGDTCGLSSSAPSITGTAEPGALIKLFFNGVQYGGGTAVFADGAGNWTYPATAWAADFGQLYGGVEVRATATVTATKLESPLSVVVCFPRPTRQCSDGLDNDGDGKTDFPDDPGCLTPTDNDETDVAECADNVDNDGNGTEDFPADTGCSSAADPLEQTVPPGAPACSDGIDNDLDGLTDYPADPGCHSPNDPSEVDVIPPGDDNVPARLLLVFDTSGSMNWNTCSGNTNTFTGGDGSNECPGSPVDCGVCNGSTCANLVADDSRMFKVKKGVSDAVAAFGEVEWGLMRYHQRPTAFACPGSNASLGSGGWQGGGAAPCGEFNSGDLIVSFASYNAYDLVQWLDNGSNWPNPGSAWRGYDFELRGTGTTPIAGAFKSALAKLDEVKAADPKQACRPYRVILVSDGKESCGGVMYNGQVRTPEYMAGVLRAAGYITYVIGFATPDADAIANLNAIAAAGRVGGTAIFVDNEAQLSVELQRIVSETVLREICDGLDNNCNTFVDETWPDKVAAKACSVGVGACQKSGHWICAPAAVDPTRSSICCGTGDPNGGGTCLDPNSGSSPEVCDGLDNDCDGMVDDGILCGIEVCNGFDDDGDGQTDEHPCGDWKTCPLPGEYQDCGISLGACTPGKTKCVSGQMTCDFSAPGQHEPVEETCDCVDNNCNGVVDEGIAKECYTAAPLGCTLQPDQSYSCAGVCRPGIQVCSTVPGPGCVPDVWSNPSCAGQIVPSTEVCNGLDDNCNGVVDDGIAPRAYYTGPIATRNVGECKDGTEVCSGGGWVVSVTQALPGAEVCDNLDNDCNGQTDDNLTRPCYPPATAGCDINTGVCVGACRLGLETCVAGSWGTCVGVVTPSAEVCDGIDNDCDGGVDENLTRTYYTGPAGTAGHGECHDGTEVCVAGTWSRNPATPGVVLEAKPSPEVCDNKDNDCDDQTDEDLTRPYYDYPSDPGTRNVGACRDGTETCQAGSWVVTTPQVTPVAEVCNGIDDNCNGQVDDGLSRSYYTGPAGTSGVGLCHDGTEVCASGVWSRDPATPGVVVEVRPTPEACDNQDNDCDSQTDEDLTRTYYTGPGGTRNVGECRDGVETCQTGGWVITTPEILPAAQEVCNGLDDNCNGQIDEGLTRSYYNGPAGTLGQGICTAGTETCIVGNWTVTTPAVVPRPEDCNGIDDDCDGVADDGLTGVPCYPAATVGCNVTLGVCVGTCALGTKDCGGGTWGACQNAVTPVAEVCDGLDNDCDGQVDEDLVRDYYTGPGGTAGNGLCHQGQETCHLGTWEVTTPQVVPVPEVCDLLDNDCDGVTDNGLDAVPCYTGPYGCNLQTGLCIGACTFGTKTCVNGAFGDCDNQIVPTAEVCNGLDDDCDGQIDEGLARDYYTGPANTDGVGPCHHGVEACSDGQWLVTTQQVVPAPEQCNAIDDDCNGTTDDGLIDNRCYDGGAECDVVTASCLGQCRVGLRACENGAWSPTCVGQQLPVAEECNCLDDNCDGQVDNPPTGQELPGVGIACTTPGGCNGVTVCDPLRCAVVCKPTSGGLTELCNGVDDDCDGQVDEPPGPTEPPLCDVNGKCAGATTTCLPPFPQQGWDYVCAAGHNECIEGSIQCVGFVLPETEICDGIDNDCDGVIDNGDLCDPGSVCYNGECVQPCKNDEFPCPSGRVCMAGPDLGARQTCANPGIDECYCIPSICVGVECDPGWLCREHDGNCHSLCENVTCDPNQECRFGQCVDCNVIGCPTGQLCAGGVCVDDPCYPKECSTEAPCATGFDCVDGHCQCAGTRNCVAGECIGSCENGCGPGQVCKDGECVDDPCAGVTCSGVQVCSPETGECVSNPCIGVTCAVGSVCSTRTGQCGTDPCLTTICSDCQACVADVYNMTATCEWTNVCTSTKIYAAGGCAVAQGPSGTPVWPMALLLGALALLGARRRRSASGRAGRRFFLATLAVAALSLAACEIRPWELKPDGGMTSIDGPKDDDDGGGSAQKDAEPKTDLNTDTEVCIPIPETCNGRDDDCNGVVDDVDPDKLLNDPNNCGSCGNSCDLPHTVGTCENGQCVFTCFPGWVDTNGDLGQGMEGGSNGCECFQTNGGVEACDGVDNDCDGVT